MSASAVALPSALDARARQSLGSSHDAIYRMVASALARHAAPGGRVVDVGCGGGGLHRVIAPLVGSYRGLDAVRYDGLPAGVRVDVVDLDAAEWPVAPASADVAVAVETIEHLENPWAFMRQLAALVEPGGLVIVTTPNQLSALSVITLLVKRRYSAFQDVHYPAHRTALLVSDLERTAQACGLDVVEVRYTGVGRLPLTPWHYPPAVAAIAPRWLSDNVMLVARRPR